MAIRKLGVWLDGVRVADIQSSRIGRVACRYRPEALDRWDGNIPLLSCSLPLRTSQLDAWAFTTGLLPEGQHRQSMAALAGVTTSNVIGMLARFGRDVAGAVIVSPDDPPLRDPAVEPYTADELTQEIETLHEHPLGLHDDSELSIAGVQDKMLLVELAPNTWGRPRNGYPSSHILKIDDRFYPGLVRAEHACLELAAIVGVQASSSRLMKVGGSECLIVERFDRRVGESGEISRIHQEDACQAMGIDPESAQRRAKYEAYGGPTLSAVADLFTTWATEPETQLRRLLDLAVFTVVIGNADAHGKNLGLLHPSPGVIELAPLYDLVPTMLWPQLKTDAAMHIGGCRRLPDIGLDDIVREASRWTLQPDLARRRARDLAERVLVALSEDRVDVDSPAVQAISKRTEALLASS
jgi:serine/threonine-protein kinase HipA